MAHTLHLQDDQGRKWAVIHNGDWSGNATFVRLDENEKAVEEVVVPGILVKRSCKSAVINDAIALLEQM